MYAFKLYKKSGLPDKLYYKLQHSEWLLFSFKPLFDIWPLNIPKYNNIFSEKFN